ncbi:hypothetical protein RRG08_024384 [Elysia crispata]|uniref:Uncharacterized protein n=1 Tax=Elysia crispata TaxID=231223 RepID=A0AAE0ZKV9_9GAST|nr:hypothetical protein RRG08_024384 [Elysia crispata]
MESENGPGAFGNSSASIRDDGLHHQRACNNQPGQREENPSGKTEQGLALARVKVIFLPWAQWNLALRFLSHTAASKLLELDSSSMQKPLMLIPILVTQVENGFEEY